MVVCSQSWTADDFDRELAHLRGMLAQRTQERDAAQAQLQQETAKRQALEQELATQKAIFDAFFHAANIGMVIVDPELRHLHINPALAAVNGFPLEAHKGKTLSEILPDIAQIVEPVYREVMATGKALLNVEVQGPTLNYPATIQYWVNSYFPLIGADGSLLGAGAVVVDVTNLKQVEAQLQQTLQELNYHIENSPLATVEWDQNLQVRHWSKRAEHMFGWLADDVIGKGWHDLAVIVEDDRDQMNSLIERLLDGIDNHNVCQGRSYTKDGTLIDCEWYNSALFDEAGNLKSVLSLVLDVTEQKRAEAALRKSEATNRAMLSAVPDLMIRMTRDGIWLDYMPPKGFHHAMTPEQIGRSIYDLMPTEFARERMKFVQQAFETLEPQLHEFELELDGKVLYEEARIVVCGDNEVLTMVRDISDRKRSEIALKQQTQELEQALQQLQQAQAKLVQNEKMSSLGQLVAGLAHEINNPINFIYGNLEHTANYAQDLLNLVEAYQAEYPQPPAKLQAQLVDVDLEFVQEDLPKLMASMRNGTERIRDIIKSLRTFSRLDEADMKTVDLHEGLDSTLMILQSRLTSTLTSKEIGVIKQYGSLPKVDCYAGQLNQVFMNLVTNAIDALQETEVRSQKSEWQPQITITTQYLSEPEVVASSGFLIPHVCICIADNGTGIPTEIQAKIFNPFFTTKPVGQGTGLGLSTSYQIVTEKHKGTLTCDSTPGIGSEFIIRIPVTQEEPQSPKFEPN